MSGKEGRFSFRLKVVMEPGILEREGAKVIWFICVLRNMF